MEHGEKEKKQLTLGERGQGKQEGVATQEIVWCNKMLAKEVTEDEMERAWELEVSRVPWLTQRKIAQSILSCSAQVWSADSYTLRQAEICSHSTHGTKRIINSHLCKSSDIIWWKLKPSAWNDPKASWTLASLRSFLPISLPNKHMNSHSSFPGLWENSPVHL